MSRIGARGIETCAYREVSEHWLGCPPDSRGSGPWQDSGSQGRRRYCWPKRGQCRRANRTPTTSFLRWRSSLRFARKYRHRLSHFFRFCSDAHPFHDSCLHEPRLVCRNSPRSFRGIHALPDRRLPPFQGSLRYLQAPGCPAWGQCGVSSTGSLEDSGSDTACFTDRRDEVLSQCNRQMPRL